MGCTSYCYSVIKNFLFYFYSSSCMTLYVSYQVVHKTTLARISLDIALIAARCAVLAFLKAGGAIRLRLAFKLSMD